MWVRLVPSGEVRRWLPSTARTAQLSTCRQRDSQPRSTSLLHPQHRLQTKTTSLKNPSTGQCSERMFKFKKKQEIPIDIFSIINCTRYILQFKLVRLRKKWTQHLEQLLCGFACSIFEMQKYYLPDEEWNLLPPKCIHWYFCLQCFRSSNRSLTSVLSKGASGSTTTVSVNGGDLGRSNSRVGSSASTRYLTYSPCL